MSREWTRVGRWCVHILTALFVLASVCSAQVDTAQVVRDTTIVNPPAVLDTLPYSAERDDTGAFHPTKSPWLAVGLSALVPGLGQIYDESYWKAPLIWGVGGYWVYEWITLNNKYRDYRDRYELTRDSPYLRLRDFYRDERDKFAWFLGALYFLNLLDAYVGAHLYDFDVSPDLTLDGRVVPRVTASVKLRF